MKKLIYSMITLAAMSLSFGQGLVELSGDFTGVTAGVPKPTVIFPQDLVFDIIADGTVQMVVFDEWTTSDGTSTSLHADDDAKSLDYVINLVRGYTNIDNLYDNAATTIGSITANDGYIKTPNGIAVQAGDVLTLLAGTFTFGSGQGYDPDFNPDLIDKVFSGRIFLTDETGTILGERIPEPSVFWLSAVGVLALVRRRR